MTRNSLRLFTLCSLIAGGALLAGSAAALSDNWPSFRGADAMNQAANDPRLPESWSTTENIEWKVDVPGLDVLAGGVGRSSLRHHRCQRRRDRRTEEGAVLRR